MLELEDADQHLSLARAALIGGIAEETLAAHAELGRLRAIRRDQEWSTTRRWLHVYLMNDLGEHRSRPLPEGYVAPDAEPRRRHRAHLVPVTRTPPSGDTP